MNLQSINIPPDKLQPAIFSALLTTMVKLDIIETRLSDIAQGNKPASDIDYAKVAGTLFENYKVQFLADFGE